MSEYDNTNTGVLFKEKLPLKSENSPPYTGTGNYRGEEIRIVGWVRHSKKTGEPFFSFKFEPKDDRQQQSLQPGEGVQMPRDDEVPF